MNDYPGMEDLRRFYNSCLEYNKHKPIIFLLDRCVIPVGVVLAFGLFILGMIQQMTMHVFDSPLCGIGMVCGFAMFPAKIITSRKAENTRKEESSIDFRALERYRSQYKSGGFTAGRRSTYCLHGDTVQQYQKAMNQISPTMLVPVLVVGIFAAIGITYLLTRNNQELADRAGKIVIGAAFLLVALVLGVWTLFRPLIKHIQYGRKVDAVCVSVQRSTHSAGESSSSRPIYMASVDGKDYIYFDECFANLEASEVGDVFPIYVSRKNPYLYASSQNSGNVMFGMVFMLSFGIIGAVCLVLGILNV